MKKLTLTEKNNAAKAILHRIEAAYQGLETVRFMEVCGTHTVSIFREGIRELLPPYIELVSGPGCPVCVTDQVYMDKAIAYSLKEDVIVATFADMLKVPGSTSSLQEARSNGGHIEIVYSPLEIIDLAKKNATKKIVFLAIGFETTIAVIAATVKAVYTQGLENVFFLVSHKLVPPALEALIYQKENHLHGFILPGHVSVIIGEEPYQYLPEKHHMPCAIAGFDGLEILSAIASLLEQRVSGKPIVDNVYPSVVAKKGNPVAIALIKELYEVVDEPWRGIGVLPNTGLRLKAPYDKLDIEKVYPIDVREELENMHGCSCGEVLQGIIQPPECPLFGTICTPEHAIGACMVSVEGACAAWYKYGANSLHWD